MIHSGLFADRILVRSARRIAFERAGFGRVLCGLLLAVALCLSGQIAAAVPEGELARAETLIQANQLTEAEQILQANAPGSPDEVLRWHWAMAILKQRQGAPRAAIPHLEKVVSLAPGDKRFRLELGTALAAAGAGERARYQFDLVRGGGLTPGEAEGVDRILSALEAQKNWDGFFRFAVVPESNAARRTAAESVIVAGIPFVLAPGARAKSDTGVTLGFGLAWLPTLGTDLRGRVGFGVDAKRYGSVAPDDVTLRTEFGLIQTGDRQRALGASLTFSQRWIDGQTYSTGQGVSLGFSRLTGDRGRVTAGFAAEYLRHDVFPAADGLRGAVSGEYSYAVAPNLILRAGAKVARTEARSPVEAETSYELRVGGNYAMRGGLVFGLDLAVGQSERDAVHPLFGQLRKDRLDTATLRVLHRDFRIGGFAPVLELGYEQRRSSIAFYSYDNLRASVGLTQQF